MPSDRVTETVRAYRGDKARLERRARNEAVKLDRTVTPADVIHWLLELAETQEQQAEERGSGH